ncbi:MerR family transcriptional regulator [Scytonema hofmannii FACHB-248]|uniref:MerR family transcriptional regulator n=1 Tax=Scytonema hofmannii FACHB-248 TaxID=1842502 RepID=A0ABR8H2R9_9CYAN|nr:MULTISPECIES: MerR family transcriptional regulator [Nostocales]MBD2609520.1 MerR family transcriptional regulator [Scytonema hofmannii FACHB-248]
MQQLYTTPEASKETGIPDGTIRSWLTRYPGLFQVGIHIVIEETGRKMWTVAGLDLLRSRKTAGETATPGAANFEAEDLLEALLENDSQQLAIAYYQMLPLRTLQRIKQMRCNPTPEDREIVANSVRSALNAGTSHLLLPTYQPLLLEGEGE